MKKEAAFVNNKITPRSQAPAIIINYREEQVNSSPRMRNIWIQISYMKIKNTQGAHHLTIAARERQVITKSWKSWLYQMLMSGKN